MSRLLGIVDLGGTKIYSAVVNEDGEVVGDDLRPTGERLDPESVLERMLQSITASAAAAAVTPCSLAAIGVAAPGPVNARSGHVLYPPNLPAWQDVPLAGMMAGRLNCSVAIENDANAAALGEYSAGSGRGADSMLYVTVSTGIGGGIVTDGRLYRGANGAAGEIGHVLIRENGPRCGCGHNGCLEAVASGTAIARAGRQAVDAGWTPRLATPPGEVGAESVTAELVAAAAENGDATAQAIIRDAGTALGLGLASIVNVLNPDVIVIGGGAAKIGASFLGPAEETMRRAIFARAAVNVALRTATLDYPAIVGMTALLRL